MEHKRLRQRRNQSPLLHVSHILHLTSGATMRHSEVEVEIWENTERSLSAVQVVVLANCGSSATQATVDVTVQATVLTFFSQFL